MRRHEVEFEKSERRKKTREQKKDPIWAMEAVDLIEAVGRRWPAWVARADRVRHPTGRCFNASEPEPLVLCPAVSQKLLYLLLSKSASTLMRTTFHARYDAPLPLNCPAARESMSLYNISDSHATGWVWFTLARSPLQRFLSAVDEVYARRMRHPVVIAVGDSWISQRREIAPLQRSRRDVMDGAISQLDLGEVVRDYILPRETRDTMHQAKTSQMHASPPSSRTVPLPFIVGDMVRISGCPGGFDWVDGQVGRVESFVLMGGHNDVPGEERVVARLHVDSKDGSTRQLRLPVEYLSPADDTEAVLADAIIDAEERRLPLDDVIVALQSGDEKVAVAFVREWLSLGGDPNVFVNRYPEKGEEPSVLSFAVASNCAAAVEQLLDAGADCDGGTPSPLTIAVFKGFVGQAVRLLRAGADPNGRCKTPQGEQSLCEVASRLGHTEIYRVLRHAISQPLAVRSQHSPYVLAPNLRECARSCVRARARLT